MPLYFKMEIRKLKLDDEGSVESTKLVGYHWFQAGKCPDSGDEVSADCLQGKEPGIYKYYNTTESLVDCRIPQGHWL